MGYLDADGYLHNWAQNTIVLDNGENISPEELEGLLYQCPLIKEALVYSKELKGNQILAAKIHPDMDVAQDMDSIADVIEMHIAKINRSLPKYKQIQDFSLQQYELSKTSTGKIKETTMQPLKSQRLFYSPHPAPIWEGTGRRRRSPDLTPIAPQNSLVK